MFIAALFTIAKIQKQPRCPSTEEQRKMCHRYSIEYYLAIKNEIVLIATTWMDLESTLHSETSHTEKDKYCMLSFVCGI